FEKKENCFYYITTMNENYSHPDMPKGVEEGIIKGMYLLRRCDVKSTKMVQLLGSGTILREAEAAADILRDDYQVMAEVWSVTSANELGREGQSVERW